MEIPEGLSVTKDSKIYNEEGEELNKFIQNGYNFVYYEGEKYKVANLVGIEYVPNPYNKPLLNHKDRDKLNDHYKNLEWATQAENVDHALSREDLGSQGKVYGYVRVSTDNQVGSDKYGIRTQKEEIKEWAKAQGYEVESFFVDDGYSGSTQNRPALQRLLKTVKAKYAPIVVAKFDRWSRDTFLHLYLEKEIIKAGSKLLSVAEDSFNNKDNPTHDLMREITMAFAKFESQRITARMSAGRRQKAKQGGHATGRVPFGYTKDEETGELVIDPKEAKIVKLIYRRRKEQDCSLRNIANHLNDLGEPTKAGNKWSAKSVSYILNNKKYQGILEQNVQGEKITTANKNLEIQ